jgi:hypothetical protein
MNYKDKYIKYKNKYLNLVEKYNNSQSGGADDLIYVVWNNVNLLKIFPHDFNYAQLHNPTFNIFKLSFINNYSTNVIQELNCEIINYMKSDKFIGNSLATVTMRTKLIGLYDSINVFYMYSPKVQTFWEGLQTYFNIKMRIFYGELASIKSESFQNDPSNFVKGLNILISCVSDKQAVILNNKYNNRGMYFIGFMKYTHIYGTSIIACKKEPKFLTEELLKSDEFKEIIGKNAPVVQLIKLMFHFFKVQGASYRDCMLFDENNICSKIQSLKLKIDKGEPFNSTDSCFDETTFTKCDTEKVECATDLDFEAFFLTKLSEPIRENIYTNKEYFK